MTDKRSITDKILLLDGGLASQLTDNGFTKIDSDPLWSARLLKDDPQGVIDAHADFLTAGCDIITTNSYQASVEGFQEFLKLTGEESLDLIRKSVTDMARVAVDNHGKGFIAGSVGPYGAAKHDGSEYDGNYVDNMTEEELIQWHRPRMQVLAESGVDWFAFETIPAQKEADALVRLLKEDFPTMKAWLSFSCKDELHTNHGELLSEAVKSGVNCSQVTHVGVNCTSPENIATLLDSLAKYRERKQFIAYPNSGESWTSGLGWDGENRLSDIHSFVQICTSKGVTIIGGCCRVTTPQISVMRSSVDRLNSVRAQK